MNTFKLSKTKLIAFMLKQRGSKIGGESWNGKNSGGSGYEWKENGEIVGNGGSWYCWEVVGNGLCKGNRLRNAMNSGSVCFCGLFI